MTDDTPHATPDAGDPVPADDVALRVTAIVRDLAIELHPHLHRTVAVRPDSELDRDLGFDSLGRAELMLRLDRAFAVRLPEHLLGDARTPADLIAAVLAAAPADGAARRLPPVAAALAETAEPAAARTLIEAFAAHVAAHPERPHLHLWLSDREEAAITYGELDAAARAVAGGLLAGGLEPGARVAIMLPTEAGFFHAFLGILMAGGVPVPIYPPFSRAQVEDHLRRQAGILRNAGASVLITNEEIRRVGALLTGLVDSLRRISLVAELRRSPPIGAPIPAAETTTALIQYTSGSTGDPKGVVLTHANLLANIRAMGEALDASSSDVFVSWLPLYHDMGLIGAWLGCLYYGVPSTIMPPFAFLADPARWLWAMHRHRATLSAGPNFAFELCLKAVADHDIAGLDLSALRMVVNGAEPVSPSTIARFTRRFAAYGLRPSALAPVYGLAENSVGLAFPPPGRAAIVDRVSRDALARRGVAEPAAASDVTALEFPACGQPIPRHQVRIVDARGFELPERHEGRLQFKGPSATAGYFDNPDKTRALFDGDWLESGDRAYVAGGDIFITGRIKDMIIRAGRNIYPHELEEAVGRIDGVRKGCVVAFASPDPRTGTERLIVLAETRLTDRAEREALQARIGDASRALLDLPPDEVLLAPPHTVPKTSSGKIRRSTARTLYESGTLTTRQRSLWWQLARLALAGWAHRAVRAGRTLASLGYAAWWWTSLGAIAGVVWLAVVAAPRRRWRAALVSAGARLFLRLNGLMPTATCDAEVPERGVMMVANHASYLDGAVVSAVIPGPLAFLAKDTLARQRIAGPLLRRLGAVFVRRTDTRGGIEDTGTALAAARAGERLVTFPEGTFARMPGLLPFHMGAFLIAAEAGIPVVPVTIRGTRSALRGDQWLPRPGTISVHVGRSIAADGSDFDAAIRLRDAVRAEILGRCGEPDLSRERITPP